MDNTGSSSRPLIAGALVVNIAVIATGLFWHPTGFAVRGGAVTVHRTGCAAVARMKGAGRAEVGVRWGEGVECRVTLVAESFVRPHLLADLTEAMAVEGAEIVSATVEQPERQQVRHTYTVQLPDAAQLPALMRAMRDVAGVYDVSRAQRHDQGV